VRGAGAPVLTPFLLVGSLTKDYTVALDASGTYGSGTVLALTPRVKSKDLKRIELVVDPADGHVVEWIVIDVNDDVDRYSFDGVDTATAPAASRFTVDPNAMSTYKIVTT
jgi:outer membrane lipoprotein-sorting protein